MKAFTLFLFILLFSFSLNAARVGCWRLEAGAGNVATNTGAAANCDLRVLNDQAGNSAFWSSFVPSLNGENASVWNSNIAGAWGVQSWSGYGDGVDDPTSLDFGTNDSFTILARVYMTDNGWDDGLVCKSSGASLGYYLARSGGTANNIRFRMQDANNNTDSLDYYGDAATLSGRWVYIAAVRDCSAAQGRIYVDGTKQVESTITAVGSLENTARFKLANIWASGTSADSLCGYISEAAIWNEALDSETIAFYTNSNFNTDKDPLQPDVIVTNYYLQNRLAIYYGYPSEVNGANGDLNAASNTFVKYDSVVFGAGLEEPTHGDHANTATIIERISNSGCEVFGYVDLGVSTDNHSYDTLTNKMSKWKNMGADGIFLDDYGYDYQVSRVRQTNAVAYAHSIGCVVCANAWVPEDVFSDDYDATYNPDSLPAPLKSNDVYLLESYQFEDGSYASASAWTNKSSKCFTYKTNTGVRMFCVTTAANASDYSNQRWWYAFDSAVLYNFDDVGWGEPSFSSNDNLLPWRTNHYLTIGNVFVTNANNNLPLNTAYTDEGKFWVDTTAHTSAFQDTVSPRVSSNVITFPINNSDISSGETYQVSWNSNAITDMFLKSWPIKLSLISSNYTNLLTAAVINTGGWSWTVNAPTSSNYKIELTVTDTSNNKTIRYSAGSFDIRFVPEPFFTFFGMVLIIFFKLSRNN